MARERDKVQGQRRGMHTDTGEEEGQVFRFELMAGQHIEADKKAKPRRRKVEDPETGEIIFESRYPSKTYNPGDIIETCTDLAAKYGADKYRRLDFKGTMVYGKTRVPQQQTPRGLPVKDVHDREEFDEGELQQEMIGANAETGEDLGLEVTEEADESASATTSTSDNLDDMTVSDLKAHAEKRGIDLSRAHRKSDMVDTIRKSKKK